MSEESGTLSNRSTPKPAVIILASFLFVIFILQLSALITSISLSESEALSNSFILTMLWIDIVCYAILALAVIWDWLTNTGIKTQDTDIVAFSLNSKQDDVDSKVSSIVVCCGFATFAVLGLSNNGIMSFSLFFSTIIWAGTCVLPFIPTDKT